LVVEQTQEGTDDQTQTLIDNLVLAAPVTIGLGTPRTSPALPRASRPLTISVPVIRSDGEAQTDAAVSCSFRVGGTKVSARGSFTRGSARCLMKVPPSAARRRLTGSLVVQIDGHPPLARTLAYRIT
jgi:hypothetical protein